MTDAASCLTTLASVMAITNPILTIVDTVAICLLLVWVGWIEVRMRR